MFSTMKKLFNFNTLKSAMVYYGQNLSYEKIKEIEYVIVQASHINTTEDIFTQNRENMYAYVSIGEISKDVQEYAKIKEEWIVAENGDWGSLVLDVKNKEYQAFLLEEVIQPIMEAGFKNLFFDTLDSYHLGASADGEKRVCEMSLVMLMKKIHTKYPDANLIINRGFEIVQRVSPYIKAVLFESYHFGLGSKAGTYKERSDEDKKWLDHRIDKIKDLGLDIIAVDYLDESNMQKASEAIKVIKKRGMIPYVSNRNLDIYGVTSK